MQILPSPLGSDCCLYNTDTLLWIAPLWESCKTWAIYPWAWLGLWLQWALYVLCFYSWSESQMTSDKLLTQQLLDKDWGLTWLILFLVYYFRVIPNRVTGILIFRVVYKSIVLDVLTVSCPSWPAWDTVVVCDKYNFLHRTAFRILLSNENYELLFEPSFLCQATHSYRISYAVLIKPVCCKQFSCWLILTTFWLYLDVAQQNVNLHQASSADRGDKIHKHIFVHIYACVYCVRKIIEKY